MPTIPLSSTTPPTRRPLGTGLPNVPTVPTPFSQLFGVQWRKVSVPCSSFHSSVEHSRVNHEYYGVDLPDIEMTGLKSRIYRVTMPFYNGIFAGAHEGWDAGKLYPQKFNDFVDAYEDPSEGTLIHVEKGGRQCRPAGALEYEHLAERQDGVIVIATFEEVLDLTANQGTQVSPVTQLQTAAVSFDASTADIRGLVDAYQPPTFTEDFETFVYKIAGTINAVTTSAELLVNKPMQLLNRLKQVDSAIERARDARLWPLQDASERMKEAAISLQQQTTTRSTLRTTVKTTMTLAKLASTLPGATPEDLVKLNPQLLMQPLITTGTVVRYYG